MVCGFYTFKLINNNFKKGLIKSKCYKQIVKVYIVFIIGDLKLITKECNQIKHHKYSFLLGYESSKNIFESYNQTSEPATIYYCYFSTLYTSRGN